MRIKIKTITITKSKFSDTCNASQFSTALISRCYSLCTGPKPISVMLEVYILGWSLKKSYVCYVDCLQTMYTPLWQQHSLMALFSFPNGPHHIANIIQEWFKEHDSSHAHTHTHNHSEGYLLQPHFLPLINQQFNMDQSQQAMSLCNTFAWVLF